MMVTGRFARMSIASVAGLVPPIVTFLHSGTIIEHWLRVGGASSAQSRYIAMIVAFAIGGLLAGAIAEAGDARPLKIHTAVLCIFMSIDALWALSYGRLSLCRDAVIVTILAATAEWLTYQHMMQRRSRGR